MASALRKAQTHDDRVHRSRKVKVTILASEWRSSNGELSTINRELAIQLAKFPEVEITFFLPKCSQGDKNVALDHKVKIVEATPLSCFEQLDWLCYPPDDLEIDIVVGHGIRLGKQAQVIKKSKTCKWVQVVHKDPEELKMFESYSSPNSKGEEKHENEVELCEMADHVVGVGPKLSESFRSYLSGCDKDGNVFDLTPGVFEELKTVKQVSHSDGQQRRVLAFGRGDVEDFKLKGFDIAGKAIAALEDTRLVFVGAPDGKHEEIRERLIECGVPASRLKVKGFVQDREGLKRLFKQVDLAVMPSRTEGFGLTGLEAMSAGLPVLVSGNSGFGEALRSVAFGSSFVIKSEDPAVWTEAIQNILSKERKCRLEEAVSLRDNYGRKYNWAKQIKELVDRMVSLTYEDSLNARDSLETKCNASQKMEGITEDHEEPSMEIENNQKRNSYVQLVSETSLSSDCERKADSASGNPTKISMNTDSQSQNSRKRKMSEFSCHPGTSSEDSGTFFKKHMPSNIASHEGASSLGKEPLNSWSMQNIAGSTSSIGVSPSQTRESLQRSSMPSIHTPDPVCQTAKEQSATEVQNQKFESDKLASTFIDLVTLTIGTPDLSDEKKESLKEILKPSVTAYMKYHRPSTLLDFDNFFGHMTKIYRTALVSVKISSLVISVKCPTLESLERLWKDYQSGCLNDIAERFLVTDELKRKLGLDNIRLKTTIEEENYLICKRAFLENSGEASITETSCQTVDSGQVEDSRWSEDKEQALTPMARAEKAKIVPLPRPDRRPSDSGSESTAESWEESEEESEEKSEDLKALESSQQRTEQLRKKFIGSLIPYPILLYVVAALVCYFYDFPKSWKARAVRAIPLLVFPVVVYLLKRVLHYVFVSRMSKNARRLEELKDKKRQVLEEVMEKETYKAAKDLLDKYDPNSEIVKVEKKEMTPLSPMPAGARSPTGTIGTELRQRNAVPKVEGPGGAPLQRTISEPSLAEAVTSQLNQSGTSNQLKEPLETRKSNSLMNISSPSSGALSPMAQGLLRPPGSPVPIPKPAKPILPRERTAMDKVIEYLVGDGPNNRYALICKQCCSHNGMALKDEFEFTAFRCCYCYHLNPARKQRPTAPKLDYDTWTPPRQVSGVGVGAGVRHRKPSNSVQAMLEKNVPQKDDKKCVINGEAVVHDKSNLEDTKTKGGDEKGLKNNLEKE